MPRRIELEFPDIELDRLIADKTKILPQYRIVLEDAQIDEAVEQFQSRSEGVFCPFYIPPLHQSLNMEIKKVRILLKQKTATAQIQRPRLTSFVNER